MSRASATAFVLNSKAYVLGGRIGADWSYPRDLHCYDPTTDTWNRLSDVPFEGRCNMTAVVCNNIAYCGGGFAGDYNSTDSYKKDWWAFDGTQWKQLSDLPTKYTDGLIAFTVDDKIYVGYGYNQQWTSELFAYNPSTDTWTGTLYADIKDLRLGLGLACAQNADHIFAGLGFDTYNNNSWTEYIPSLSQWQKRKPLPSKGGLFYACTATTTHVFLCGGRTFGGSLTSGKIHDDIWAYDIAIDQWSLCAHLPQPTENMIAFTIGNTPYFGLGENADGIRCNKLYKLKQ